MNPSGLLFIISGPAGSGKSTLCNRLLDEFSPNLQRVVTSTSRAPRGTEKHLVDFYFFSKAEFLQKINNDEFYEHALVFNNHYGVLKSEIRSKMSQGINLILNIDVQGASTFRKLASTDSFLKNHLITVFILPESIDALQYRLNTRGEDSQDVINKRLEIATSEIEQAKLFDFCIHSSTKEHDYDLMRSIYLASNAKVQH